MVDITLYQYVQMRGAGGIEIYCFTYYFSISAISDSLCKAFSPEKPDRYRIFLPCETL